MSEVAEQLNQAANGRYRIEKMIGEGGMGQVFLAHDSKLDREVCIKVILEEGADDDRRERFYREAKALAAMNHPAIVRIFDYSGKDEALHYIVMERLTGQTLETLVDIGPLPEPFVCAMMHEVLRGLSHAHAASIIHRDLKPSNIFIENTGRAVVIDFGLAKGLQVTGDRNTFRISQTKLVGSPLFSSPEQFAPNIGLSPRADIFSLGSVAYHALSQVYPFQGQTVSEVLQSLMQRPPIPLPDLIDISPRLWGIIQHMLEKTPAARPENVNAVLAELAPLLHEHRIISPSDTLAEFLQKGHQAAPKRDRTVTVAFPTTDERTRVSAAITAPAPPQKKRSWIPAAFAVGALLVAGVLWWVLRPAKTVVTPVSLATPAPAPLPEPVKDTAATTGTATLRLFVKPWGNVTIDGEARGITPTFRFAKLTIGEHEVVVSNPAFGERKVNVTLPKADEEVPLVIDLTRP